MDFFPRSIKYDFLSEFGKAFAYNKKIKKNSKIRCTYFIFNGQDAHIFVQIKIIK